MAKKKPHPQTCEKCPNRYSKDGCPCWIGEEMGFAERNEKGEIRALKGCFYQVAVRMLYDFTKSMDIAAQSVQSTRNEMVNGLSVVAAAVGMHQRTFSNHMEQLTQDDTKQIENENGKLPG